MSNFGTRNSGFFNGGTSGGGGGGGIIILGSGTCSSVRCGASNTASGEYSTSLGKNNSVSGCCSIISGGECNQANGRRNTVGGGCFNVSCGQETTISGGKGNVSFGDVSSVGGGIFNTSTGIYSTVSGGGANLANNCASTISGGTNNSVTEIGSFIGGGALNTISGYDACYSSIVGGYCNSIASGSAYLQYNTIGGGSQNTISANYGNSTISGGSSHFITIDGARSTIGGGVENTISNVYATISGGYLNTSSGYQSSILGGGGNTASGCRSSVLGGSGNTASCYGSTAYGVGASSYLYGMQANASSFFTTQGDSQISNLVARKSAALTTAATSILSLDGTGTTNLIIPSGSNRLWNVLVQYGAVVVSKTGTATSVNVGDVKTHIDLFNYKLVGGVGTVSTITSAANHNDASMATADMTYANNAGSLQVRFVAPTFTGGGTVTFRITARIQLTEVAW